VVIEANFRPYSEYERGRLASLAALGGHLVEVHCQCPAEVAAARYNARRGRRARARIRGRFPARVFSASPRPVPRG
jgi:predicted kinase